MLKIYLVFFLCIICVSSCKQENTERFPTETRTSTKDIIANPEPENGPILFETQKWVYKNDIASGMTFQGDSVNIFYYNETGEQANWYKYKTAFIKNEEARSTKDILTLTRKNDTIPYQIIEKTNRILRLYQLDNKNTLVLRPE